MALIKIDSLDHLKKAIPMVHRLYMHICRFKLNANVKKYLFVTNNTNAINTLILLLQL